MTGEGGGNGAEAAPRRFFARLKNFELSCPNCAHMNVVKRMFKAGKRVRFTRRNTLPKSWDPVLSRLTCAGCGLTMVLGIVAYAAPRVTPSPPPDVIPTREESAALRSARLGGEWEPEKIIYRGRSVNRLRRVKEMKA